MGTDREPSIHITFKIWTIWQPNKHLPFEYQTVWFSAKKLICKVPDVIWCVRMGGSKNSFPNQKSLHSHFIRVRDNVFELIETLDLDRVFVSGDWWRHNLLRTNQHSILVPKKRKKMLYSDHLNTSCPSPYQGIQLVPSMVQLKAPQTWEAVALSEYAYLSGTKAKKPKTR